MDGEGERKDGGIMFYHRRYKKALFEKKKVEKRGKSSGEANKHINLNHSPVRPVRPSVRVKQKEEENNKTIPRNQSQKRQKSKMK